MVKLLTRRTGVITFFENAVNPNQQDNSAVFKSEVTGWYHNKFFRLKGEIFGEETEMNMNFEEEHLQFHNSENNDRLEIFVSLYTNKNIIYFLGIANLHGEQAADTRRFEVCIELQQEE